MKIYLPVFSCGKGGSEYIRMVSLPTMSVRTIISQREHRNTWLHLTTLPTLPNIIPLPIYLTTPPILHQIITLHYSISHYIYYSIFHSITLYYLTIHHNTFKWFAIHVVCVGEMVVLKQVAFSNIDSQTQPTQSLSQHICLSMPLPISCSLKLKPSNCLNPNSNLQTV